MKKIRTSLKKQKEIWLFLIIILLFGFGVGIYFGITESSFLQSTIANYALTLKEQTISFAIPHFTILSLLLVLSFLGIGVPFALAYLFYEGMSLGFCGTVFCIAFGWKGFLFIIIFYLLAKIPFLILYAFFFQKILLIVKSLISWIIYKNDKKDYLIKLTIGCFILIIFLLIYDILLDFLGIKIIQAFYFLLN